MLSDNQKKLVQRFHLSCKKPYTMDEILSYVIHGGDVTGGNSLKINVLYADLNSLGLDIRNYIESFEDYFYAVQNGELLFFNKAIHRRKGYVRFIADNRNKEEIL